MAYQPKSYRKFVATAATATLVASAVTPVFAAETGAAATFTDVPARYTTAVDFLLENQITNGISETEFGTTLSIKRVDAAVMIAKALKLDLSNRPASGFVDVPARAAVYVDALKQEGYINGKTATSFGAADTITRGEIALIFANAYGLKGTAAHTFSDVSSRYDAAVQALVAAQITQGKTATSFGTADAITRGEFAIFLHRAETLPAVTGPEVASVNAASATQVQIQFTQAVNPATLFVDGKSGAFVANTVSLSSLDSQPAGALTGKLSADGKVLTVTSANPLSKRYDVVVDALKTVEGNEVAKYEKMVTIAADKVAPTILSTTKPAAGTVKVTFSEPLKSLGNVSYKLADGTVVSTTATGVTTDFTTGAQEVTFTLGTEIAAGKEAIATIIGAQDQAGNLLTPNPATVSLYKGTADGVAPTVSSVSQTGATTFAVKFSEQLQTTPVVSINGTAVASANIVKDATDPTVYNVTAPAALDGATTVQVSSFTDLSGEAGTATSRVVAFVKDTVAPKVVASGVAVDETNRKEYLEITFDKDVELATATVDAVGSYVKDYVTTAVGAADLAPTAVSYKSATNKKVVRVELDALLGGTTTDIENATYNLDLTFTGITNGAGVAVTTAKTSFTRGKDGVGANTAVVAVTSVAQAADNNKVNVTFDRAVDGASATNPANYKVDGAIVESVTLTAPAAGGTQVAVLNLKANSNAFTGTRNIEISNVKALGSSKVMTPFFTNTVSLRENVAPTVTSARLTATDTITLTFSEAVTSAPAVDFEVLIGGQSQTTAENVNVTVTSATTATVTIQTIDATELSKGIALKPLSTIDITDAAGNVVAVPANVTVSN